MISHPCISSYAVVCGKGSGKTGGCRKNARDGGRNTVGWHGMCDI